MYTDNMLIEVIPTMCSFELYKRYAHSCYTDNMLTRVIQTTGSHRLYWRYAHLGYTDDKLEFSVHVCMHHMCPSVWRKLSGHKWSVGKALPSHPLVVQLAMNEF